MEYPKYKKKKMKPTTKILFTLNLASLLLCLFIPWYVYIQGSIMLMFMARYVYKRFSGYKLVAAFTVSVMVMLLLFDFADRNISWSLDYVMPSFLIFLTTLMLVIVMFRKKKWVNYYSFHVYYIVASFFLVGLMFFGLMESFVMGIVTLSIFAASLIAIWIRVGKHYHRNLLKFIHI